MKRKALGRGLSAILSDSQPKENLAKPENPAKLVKPGKSERSVEEIPVASIAANHLQPRSQFDNEKMEELCESIKNQGVLQPLLVRKKAPESGKGPSYELIAGERRLRASKMADKEKVPCIVLNATEDQMLEIALVENIQRADLNPVEEAKAYQLFSAKFSWTQAEIASKVGKSRSAVANSIRLLDLPSICLEALEKGDISTGHAKCLLSVDDKEKMSDIAETIIQDGLSVRETETLIQALKNPPESKPEKPQAIPPQEDMHIQQLRRSLEDRFQTRVNLKMQGKNKGKIEISFHDLDQLDALLKKWGVTVQ